MAFRSAGTHDINAVLSLDELGAFADAGNNPAETLMNVVGVIAKRFGTDVCSAYLLEPDRVNLILAATVGLRPECVGTLRLGLHEGLVGLVAEQVRPVAVEHAQAHPRFKYFSEAGEEPFQSFLGVPLIDNGVLQGTLVVQTLETRHFSDEEIEALTAAAAQVAPIISEARVVHRFIAPAQEKLWALARNLWWSWDQDSGSLFRDLDPARWSELNHNPISLLQETPLAQIEKRAGELALHSRINYAYRRQREYLEADQTWAATHAGVLRPRPVGYFSAEFGLHESFPIYSGGLGVLAGDHIKSASDLGLPLVGIGLFYGQGYFRQRLDRNGWQREEYLSTDTTQMPMEPAIGESGEPVTVQLETRGGVIAAKVWRVRVGRCDLLLLDSNVEGNSPEDRELTSRLYGGDARVRIRQELLLGVGGFKALRAMGITPVGAAPQRRAQRLRRARSDPQPDDRGRHRLPPGGAAGGARGGVHHAHAGAGRPRPLPREPHRGAPRAAARSARHLAARADGARPREPGQPARRVLHDRAGAEAVAARQRRVGAARRGVARDVDRASIPGRSEDAVPIGHITNGVHVPTWLAPQMSRLYDRHLGLEWRQQQRRGHDLGRHRERRRRRALGDAPDPEGAAHRVRAAARRGAGHATAASPKETIARLLAHAEPRRADDRLRAPLRHLQARQPDPARPRGAGRRW